MDIPSQNGHANGEANGHADHRLPEATSRARQRKAVVVGAGPVGCLTAIALANKGWSVEVYEGRAGVACFSPPMTPFVGLPSSPRQAPDQVARGPAFD